MNPSSYFNFSIEKHDVGKRLDVFVAERIPSLTRSQAKRLIQHKQVAVEGRPLKASHLLRLHETVNVHLPVIDEENFLQAEVMPLSILYEDRDIIVIDKPAGLVVHPAVGNKRGTLVNGLLAHCRDLSSIGGEAKPGIVHRLDKGTSGVMVVAKNDVSHGILARQFAERSVLKIYRALVFGKMRQGEGTFAAALGRSLRDRKKISSRTRKGRIALTEWVQLESFASPVTLVEVRLRTGRTHQIRVHFAEGGHPLVGDVVYGGAHYVNRVPPGPLRMILGSFARPALHAYRLGFLHPRTGERCEFSAALPTDFQQLLQACRGHRAL